MTLILISGLGIVEPLVENGLNCLSNKKMQINELVDLNKYKTAPVLDFSQSQKLSRELDTKIYDSDWLTIGVMAKSDVEAKIALKTIIQKYPFMYFKNFEDLNAMGNVFMKGNQKTGEVYIRSDQRQRRLVRHGLFSHLLLSIFRPFVSCLAFPNTEVLSLMCRQRD